jgi:2'-5' RNA ligase/GNAT superfamily N-acetyltransferase
LLLPPPVRDEVDGLRRALGDPSLDRVPAHLTLVPPVNVRQDDLGRALAVLRAAAAAAPPVLRLVLGPPDSFLPANPVLYLVVGGDVEALHRLRDAVFLEPLARSLSWPFVPHLTLADGAEPALIEAATNVLGRYRIVVSIERVHLLREIRGEEGRTWDPLADAAFAPPAIVGVGSPLALELVRSELVDPEGMALLSAEGITSAGGVTSDRPKRPGHQLVLTARREGAVVGVATAWLTPDGGRVGVLVASAHRGQGIGSHLLAAVESGTIEADWNCSSLAAVGPPRFYTARSRLSKPIAGGPNSPTTQSGSTSTG